MSPSENMFTLDTERAALSAGAWKAWADSRRARATTAADFICISFCQQMRAERLSGVRGRAAGAGRARAVSAGSWRCGAASAPRERDGNGWTRRRGPRWEVLRLMPIDACLRENEVQFELELARRAFNLVIGRPAFSGRRNGYLIALDSLPPVAKMGRMATTTTMPSAMTPAWWPSATISARWSERASK